MSRRSWLALLLVLVLAVVPFLGALRAGFVFDDFEAVVRNPVVKGHLDLGRVFGTPFWGAEETGRLAPYRPVVVLSFILDERLGGGGPFAYHLGNLVWHALCAVAAYLVLLDRLRRPGLAAGAAALFAVHALHGENVAGIVGRADVIAALFALCAYAVARRRPAWAGLPFLAALLAKETAVAIVLVLVVEDLLRLDAERRRRWLAYGSMAAALAFYLVLRVHALGRLAGWIDPMSNPLVGAGVGERVLTAGALLARTVSLLIAPLSLSADYSYAEILPATGLNANVIEGLALFVLLPAAAFLARRRRPALAFGLVLFLCAYLPVANLAFLIPTIFAERLLYLAVLGFALVCAALVDAAPARLRAPLVGLAALVVALHGWRDVGRAAEWRSQRSLFVAATHDTPASARAWYNLAVEELAGNEYAAAADHFGRAVEIRPEWAFARTNLGIALASAGEPARAEAELRRAIADDPSCRPCARNLEVLLRAPRPRSGEAASGRARPRP